MFAKSMFAKRSGIALAFLLACGCSLVPARAGAQSQASPADLLQGLAGAAGSASGGPLGGLLGLSKPAQVAGGGETPEDCSGSVIGQMLDMLFADLQGFAGRSGLSDYLPQLDAIKPLARQFLAMSQGSYCETRTALLLFAMIATLERRLGDAEAIYDKVLPPCRATWRIGPLTTRGSGPPWRA